MLELEIQDRRTRRGERDLGRTEEEEEMSSNSSKREKRTKKKNDRNKLKKEVPEIVMVVPSSSASEEANGDKLEEEEEEEEAKSSNNSNQNVNGEAAIEDIIKSRKHNNKIAHDSNGSGGDVSCFFPTNRIKRIIRSEGSDFRITHEAIFLINKATEHFLELFCEDAYANVVQDRKKTVDYKHLSSVVCRRKRYDFLSDFVPEKVRVEDALSEKLAGI